MVGTKKVATATAAGIVLALSGVAQAQETEVYVEPELEREVYVEEERDVYVTEREQERLPVREAIFMPGVADPRKPDMMITPFGMSLTVGGGVIGFIESNTRDVFDPGGFWEARYTFGTRNVIAGELAYIGQVHNIDTPGLDPDAILLANGGELAARLNFLPGMWQPYVLVGAGLRHFVVANDDFNTSSVRESEDVIHFPVGAGLAFRFEGLVLDLRALIRATGESDLTGRENANLHTGAVDLKAGWEF